MPHLTLYRDFYLPSGKPADIAETRADAFIEESNKGRHVLRTDFN